MGFSNMLCSDYVKGGNKCIPSYRKDKFCVFFIFACFVIYSSKILFAVIVSRNIIPRGLFEIKIGVFFCILLVCDRRVGKVYLRESVVISYYLFFFFFLRKFFVIAPF